MEKFNETEVKTYIRNINYYCDKCNSIYPVKFVKTRHKYDNELDDRDKELVDGWHGRKPPNPLGFIHFCKECGEEYLLNKKYPIEEVVYKDIKGD